MANRLDLHSKLKEMLENKHVYYQPPESIKMAYPAIRYSKQTIMTRHADDIKYSMMDCYQVIVISREPDHPVLNKLLSMRYCSFNRHYVADNLHHDEFTLYF